MKNSEMMKIAAVVLTVVLFITAFVPGTAFTPFTEAAAFAGETEPGQDGVEEEEGAGDDQPGGEAGEPGGGAPGGNTDPGDTGGGLPGGNTNGPGNGGAGSGETGSDPGDVDEPDEAAPDELLMDAMAEEEEISAFGIMNGFEYQIITSQAAFDIIFNDPLEDWNSAYVGPGAYIIRYTGAEKIPVVPQTIDGQPVVYVKMMYYWSGKTFTTIDFSAATQLKTVRMVGVKLTSTLNFKNNTALEDIYLEFCPLSGINVTGLTSLKQLGFIECNLTSLSLQTNTALEELTVFVWADGKVKKNTLDSLDLSNNTNLKYLQLNTQKMTSLDLSANNKLEGLFITNNEIKSLDVSGKTNLLQFWCTGNNNLTSLNISGCNNLKELCMQWNGLATLTGNIPAGCAFEIWNNKLTDIAFIKDLIVKASAICDYNWYVPEQYVLPQNNIHYIINFNSQGGSAVEPKGIKSGSSLGALPAPTRSGYVLNGWYTQASGGSKISAATKPSSNIQGFTGAKVGVFDYFAQWDPGYNITFNTNGGDTANSTIQILQGAKIGKLPTPARVGYTFTGWFDAASGGAQITADKVFAANSTIYAQWRANTYKLTLNAAGGNASAKSGMVTYNATHGAAFGGALPEATRTGYVFDGWWTEKDTSVAPETSDAGTQILAGTTVKHLKATTLFAHWTAEKYTVTFDLNKDAHGLTNEVGFATGTGDTRTSDVYFGLPFGSAIHVAENKNSSGTYYAHTGWFTMPGTAGGAKLTEKTKATLTTHGNTYYARWDEAYKVTWSVTNISGTETDSFDTFVSKKTKKVGALPEPTGTPEGYTLAGWYAQATGIGTGIGKVSKSTSVADHTTYTSVWKPASFKANYDLGYTAKPPGAKNVTYLKAYGKLAVPKRVGYVFNGWWTDNGSPNWGTQVTADMPVEATGAHTLYAKWDARDDIVVKFDPNGGTALTPTNAQRLVTFGSTLGTLPVPVRPSTTDGKDYVFAGWYTAKTGGTQVTNATVVETVATKTYFARWTQIG